MVHICEIVKSNQIFSKILNQVSSEGKIVYSQIRTFMEKQPTAATTYKSIKTSLNHTISLTGNHLLYARLSGAEKFNTM